MNIDERIKYLHRVYKVEISNLNIENTDDAMLIIRMPQNIILDKLEEDDIELNDNKTNIRFSLKEDGDLVDHNRNGDYYYIRLKYINAGETISLYLNIFSKSYSYQEDESIFLYQSRSEDFTIEPSSYYEVDGTNINFMQENPDGTKEIRNPENKTINRDHPEDYYAIKKEYDEDNISNVIELPIEEESTIIETNEDNRVSIGSEELVEEIGFSWRKEFSLEDFNWELEDGNLKYPITIDINKDNEGHILSAFNTETWEDYYFLPSNNYDEETIMDALKEYKKLTLHTIGDQEDINALKNPLITFKQTIPKTLQVEAKTEFNINIKEKNTNTITKTLSELEEGDIIVGYNQLSTSFAGMGNIYIFDSSEDYMVFNLNNGSISFAKGNLSESTPFVYSWSSTSGITNYDNKINFNILTNDPNLLNKYINYGINGEKVIFDKLSEFQSLAIDYLNTDYDNIRFYNPNTNKLLKHYRTDNQGIKKLIFEIPYEEMEKDEINLEILIMEKDYQHENNKSIFSDYYNYKETIPDILLPWVDTVNGEQVYYDIAANSNINYALPMNAAPYIDFLAIEHVLNIHLYKRLLKNIILDDNTGFYIGTDIGTPSIWLPSENSNGALQGDATGFTYVGNKWKISRLLANPNKIVYYEDLDDMTNVAKRTVNLSNLKNYKKFYTSRWSGYYTDCSAHLFMQNPYQTTNKILTVDNLSFMEFTPGNGYWTTTQPYTYVFDKDIKSKKLKISFDIELPEEINKNEVTGIALTFDRTKTGNEIKKDEILQIIVNDEEGQNKAKLENYINNEMLVYGGIEDKWMLDNFSDNMTIDFIYRIVGISKDSTTQISISNLKIIVFYKFYDFKDYPAFSRHDGKPYLYKKLELDDGNIKWVAEDYDEETKSFNPVKVRMSTDVFGKLDKEKVNIHVKHKYNPASSMNTEHLFGFISNDPERKSIVGAAIDNLDVLLSDESELLSERLINHDTIDKKSMTNAGVHNDTNIGKYYEYCLKYLPRKVIMQSIKEDSEIERTIERESEEE